SVLQAGCVGKRPGRDGIAHRQRGCRGLALVSSRRTWRAWAGRAVSCGQRGCRVFEARESLRMASTDAKEIPLKNTAYRLTVPMWKADGTLCSSLTGLDSEVSKDGG